MAFICWEESDATLTVVKLNMTIKRPISTHDSVGRGMPLYPIVVWQQFGPDMVHKEHRDCLSEMR